MTASTSSSQHQRDDQLLAGFHPFDRLPAAVLAGLAPLVDVRRYRLGQTLLRPEVMPEGVLLLRSGRLRCLAPDPLSNELRTIDRLEPGSLVGWCSLLRGAPGEHIRASTEAELLFLPAPLFLDLISQHDTFRLWFQNTLPAAELHLLLADLCRANPAWLPALRSWPAIRDQALVRSLPAGSAPAGETLPLALAGDRRWFASSGAPLAQAWRAHAATPAPPAGAPWLRLVGLPPLAGAEPGPAPYPDDLPALSVGGASPPVSPPATASTPGTPAPPAGSYALSAPEAQPRAEGRGDGQLRLARATGPRDAPLAICLALAHYFGLPVNRDALLDQLNGVLQRQPQVNLVNLGQLLDSIGLRVVLTRLPLDRLERVATPAVLHAQGHFALLESVGPDGQLRLLEPELGPLQLPPAQLVEGEANTLELLLLERKPDAKEQRFSWSWFGPFLKEHRRQLVEVVVLSAAINVLGLAFPLGFRVLIDSVVRQNNLNALLSIASLLLVAALLTAILSTLRSYILTDTTNRVDQATKSTILDHMVRLPQGFFDSRPVGQVMFYFNQLDRLRDFLLGSGVVLAVDVAFSFLYLFILFSMSIPLTLVALSTLPLTLGLTLLSSPLVRAQIKRTLAASVATYSYLTESITGIQTIKSQNAELKTRWEFQNRYARFVGEDFKLRISRETIRNISKFISDLNRLLIMGVGIYLAMTNVITIGSLIAFRILAGKIIDPLDRLTDTWLSFQQTSASLRMMADVVDRTPEQTTSEALNLPMPPLVGHVQFQAVDFRFSDTGPLVLHGVDLDVPVGSFVGVVGGSGSGKSSLLKLLPRFYRPGGGKVLIDGLDINKVELYSLRRQIGVVPQDSVLFDGTVRENLLLVKPDASAEELMRAARIACAHDFIMELPKGYNSDVGERGAGLSGGQRQRLALARAVLQNPRLLILDEATSALDARTERQVCMNLFEAFRGRTVFFITHRLTTVQAADMLVLMDQGAVMETGTHRELMQRQGWYYALHASQTREGVL